MMRASSLNRLDRHVRVSDMRTQQDPRVMLCAQENVPLAQENQVLRQSYADLTTAAETWIRLYESALARANAAEQALARLTRPEGWAVMRTVTGTSLSSPQNGGAHSAPARERSGPQGSPRATEPGCGAEPHVR
jgi:hypothetical protein